MSINEDLMQPTSDSFWEVNNYKRVVKRVDNGYKHCESLKSLIESRQAIEKDYAKSLQNWSKRWNDYLDKGNEYGTLQAGWRGVLSEADKLCAIHNRMAEQLMEQVHAKIKMWQKENYHKSMMHFKETKEFEDGFRKAQKPWTKRLNKVLTTKKDYHTACRQEKSTANQENNARGDPTMSQDQVKKLQDKLQKCAKEVDATRKTYEAALNDLNGYNAKYIEDMTQVFNSCQDFEHKRMEFFKEMLLGIHKCLDLSDSPEYDMVYKDMEHTISCVDAQKDLKWWSNCNGAGMGMNWPVFEEYSPELQSISRKGKSGQVSASGDGITITSIKHSREGSYASNSSDPGHNQTGHVTDHNSGPPQQQYNQRPTREDSYDKSLNPFGSDSEEDNAETSNEDVDKIVEEGVITASPHTPDLSIRKQDSSDSYDSAHTNPFDDDDDFGGDVEDGSLLVDDGRPGVPVRALYDYVAVEKDELSFKSGDVFSKLEDEDEQGWCKGRKDGRIGLYPANYVETM